MAAKILEFDQAARRRWRRRPEPRPRGEGDFRPEGRNAVIDKGWGSPTITKDGVSVAKEIDLKDPLENMGAQLVKEAASKTSDVAGDGTTTSTVLAEAIFLEAYKYAASGANVTELNRGIRQGAEAVVAALKAMSKQVAADKKSIQQVATIAANGDLEVGKMIAEAMDKVGKDGVITVEEGKTLETTVEVIQGMQFDRGWLSPHFVTDPSVWRRARAAPHPDLGGKISPPRGSAAAREGREDGRPPLTSETSRATRSRPSKGPARGSSRAPRQGARLRRPPQGDARGHLDPHEVSRSS